MMSEQRRRKLNRLHGFDYRTPSLYHVVTSTRHGICRFGDVRNGVMHPNEIGQRTEGVWNAIPDAFPSVSLDASVVMPNHHDGVIFLEPQKDDAPGPALGDVMRWFKTVTTVRYIRGVRELGWPPYEHRLWHRNYYDQIVRDERDLDRIRQYIENNPANWDTDTFYPEP